jgi:hypothetical protein
MMVVGAVVVVGAAVFSFFSPFFVCVDLLMNKTTMIVHLATEKEEMDFFHAHLRAGGTLSWLGRARGGGRGGGGGGGAPLEGCRAYWFVVCVLLCYLCARREMQWCSPLRCNLDG